MAELTLEYRGRCDTAPDLAERKSPLPALEWPSDFVFCPLVEVARQLLERGLLWFRGLWFEITVELAARAEPLRHEVHFLAIAVDRIAHDFRRTRDEEVRPISNGRWS